MVLLLVVCVCGGGAGGHRKFPTYKGGQADGRRNFAPVAGDAVPGEGRKESESVAERLCARRKGASKGETPPNN